MSAKKEKKVSLDFTMQQQLGHAMCWAAVGTSCALFYDSDSKWTQCKLASQSIGPDTGDCCANPEDSPCDIVWYLQNDENLGSFVTAGIARGYKKGFLPYKKLVGELDAGRIIAFLLRMDIDGTINNRNEFSHFVAIAGYEWTDSEENVTIYDSFFGKSEMPYKEFVTNYKCHGGTVLGHAVKDSLVEYTFFSTPTSTP